MACLLLVAPPPHSPAAGELTSGAWGRIANAPLDGERVIGSLFFAGPPNPRFVRLYTRTARDPQLMEWSDEAIHFALEQMLAAGMNTIKLSYWGIDGETDRWSPSLLFAKQRWPGSHHERRRYSEAEQIALARHFFRLAGDRGLMIAPMLEVSPRFKFWEEFPHDTSNLEDRAAWLLEHFGGEANYLRLYDRDGQPRHVIWLIETIHHQQIDAEQFAAAFDDVAARLEARTGHRVGFVLDPTPLPPYGSHHGPDPAALRARASILAINPFNITSQGVDHHDDAAGIPDEQRLAYARKVLQQWSASELPLIAPVIPGYDAHRVFPQFGRYGLSRRWRDEQSQLALRYATAGLSVDCWNGWTEAYAIPPSEEDGDAHLRWIEGLVRLLRQNWSAADQRASARPPAAK